jgi:hypothetical protein
MREVRDEISNYSNSASYKLLLFIERVFSVCVLNLPRWILKGPVWIIAGYSLAIRLVAIFFNSL